MQKERCKVQKAKAQLTDALQVIDVLKATCKHAEDSKQKVDMQLSELHDQLQVQALQQSAQERQASAQQQANATLQHQLSDKHAASLALEAQLAVRKERSQALEQQLQAQAVTLEALQQNLSKADADHERAGEQEAQQQTKLSECACPLDFNPGLQHSALHSPSSLSLS